jgi:hypothetical protein
MDFRQLPWAEDPRGSVDCLHLDEYGADVCDGANVRTVANTIAYLKFHSSTSVGSHGRLLPASRPPHRVVEPWDGQLTARMPTEGAAAVAPVVLVPNRIRLHYHAATTGTVGPRQHGIPGYRSARTAADDHEGSFRFDA